MTDADTAQLADDVAARIARLADAWLLLRPCGRPLLPDDVREIDLLHALTEETHHVHPRPA